MKKGSITVYLSLILCVLISLIFAAMDSARLSCGRAVAALAAEEGMFSLFGEYDRILYEKYGILAIDGGYGSSELKAGILMDEAAGITEKVLAQGKIFPGSGASNIFRADIDTKAVTGYVLATDSGGQMLKEQIKSLMIRKIGWDAAVGLSTYYTGAANAAEAAETFDIDRMDSLKTNFEEGKAAAEEARRAAEEAAVHAAESSGLQTENESEHEPDESKTVVSDQVQQDSLKGSDIIENIYALKRLGIMAAAVPDLNSISTSLIPVDSMPSKRTLQTGMGGLPQADSSSLEAVLLAKYLTDYFPSFRDNSSRNDFRYQIEYIIGGKSRDVDNLKSVLNRLMAIRMSLNYAYLLAHPEVTEEAGALALSVSVVLLIPEFYELIRQIILLCWSYGESMLDLKTLMSGGKVPLLKDVSSWQTSLSGMASLSVTSAGTGQEKGLDYKEYLYVLLLLKGTNSLMKGIEDLLEYNRRVTGDSPGFSIDTCICSMELQYEGCIGAHSFLLTRRYGYDTKSFT